MAKGLRSSTKKANRTQLRSGVFGPVEEARKERLSAKLLELASKPRVLAEEDVKMTQGHKGAESLNITGRHWPATPTSALSPREEQQKKEATNSSNAAQDIGSAEEG